MKKKKAGDLVVVWVDAEPVVAVVADEAVAAVEELEDLFVTNAKVTDT